jgi:hypothetical protein
MQEMVATMCVQEQEKDSATKDGNEKWKCKWNGEREKENEK